MAPRSKSTPPLVSLDGYKRAEAPRPRLTVGPERLELPRPRTPLVGREAEVAEVVAAFSDGHARLVTVVGPGGVGKTRIALEAAHALGDHLSGGVVFVPLAGVGVAADLPEAITGSLTLAGAAGLSAAEVLRAGLRHQDVVLVLDNFEHLTDAVHDVVDILDSCPGVCLLVTSRTALRCTGEVVIELSPLPVPHAMPDELTADLLADLVEVPSVSLFAQRAAAARPDFALDGATATLVATVCQRVAGLPLAIELAAARLGVLTLPDLAARLQTDPLAVLSRGARDLPARQQSLQATIEWSLRLLTDHERVLLERISVFEHGFSLAAAEVVCPDPDDAPEPRLAARDVLDALSALVDAHLVEPDQRDVASSPAGGDGREHARDEARFALPVPVRELAASRLAAHNGRPAIEARLDEYFLEFAAAAGRGLEGSDEQRWLNRVGREIDQLRVVLARLHAARPLEEVRVAAALGPFWLHRGLLAEGRAHLEPAATMVGSATLDGSADQVTVAMALAWDARLAADQGVVGDNDFAGVTLDRLRRALDVAKNSGRNVDVLRVMEFLSDVLISYLDDIETAQAITDQGIALARACGETWWLAQFLQRAATFSYRRGDPVESRALASEAIRLARELGADRLVLRAGLSLVQLPPATDARAADEPVPDVGVLLEMARAISSPRAATAVHRVVALQALMAGDTPRAAGALRDALLIARDINYWQAVGHCVLSCVVLAGATGEHDVCAELMGAIEPHIATLRRSVPTAYLRWCEHTVEQVRATADQATFDRGLARGADWDWEETIARAIAFVSRLATRAGTQQADPREAGAQRVPGPRAEVGYPSLPGAEPLTAREHQILELITAGHTNKAIAGILGLSPKTVMHHTARIYRKLDVTGRTEAAAVAARQMPPLEPQAKTR